MGTFTDTDAKELYDNMMEKLQDKMGYLEPGDERRIFAETFLEIYVAIHNTIDDCAKQSLLRYARGEILDMIGEGTDCNRLQGEKATTTLRFELDWTSVEGGTIEITKGTRVMTSKGEIFATTLSAVAVTTTDYLDITAESVESGKKYNGIIPGSINIMESQIQSVSSVRNTTETEGGTDIENDENYRERIKMSYNAYSTCGSEEAWKYWAKSASDEIGDVFVTTELNEGSVCVGGVSKDGKKLSNNATTKMMKVLTSKELKPVGDLVELHDPEVTAYDINVRYYVTPEDETEAVEAIESKVYVDKNGITRTGAIEEYRLWQDTHMGRGLNPDKLKSIMMNPAGDGSVAGATRVEIISPVYRKFSNSWQVARMSENVTIEHIVEE